MFWSTAWAKYPFFGLQIMDYSVVKTLLDTKINDVENKILDHAEYVAKWECNKLTAVNLVSKTDLDNKLISFNRKITSHKTKYLKVLKEVSNLTTKFFWGRN